jgi:hypothetical protein
MAIYNSSQTMRLIPPQAIQFNPIPNQANFTLQANDYIYCAEVSFILSLHTNIVALALIAKFREKVFYQKSACSSSTIRSSIKIMFFHFLATQHK